MKVNGVIQRRAPIVRLAFHPEQLGQVTDFHPDANPADVVHDEPHLVAAPAPP
jgi:hypothetical protein